MGAIKDAELSGDDDRENDEEEIRCKSSNVDSVVSQSKMSQNLDQDDLDASSRLPAGRRRDLYQVPLLQQDVPVEGDVQLRGSYHEEFPQPKEAEVLCCFGKFWGDC